MMDEKQIFISLVWIFFLQEIQHPNTSLKSVKSASDTLWKEVGFFLFFRKYTILQIQDPTLSRYHNYNIFRILLTCCSVRCVVVRLYEWISVSATRHIVCPFTSPTFSLFVITIKYAPTQNIYVYQSFINIHKLKDL